MVTAQISPKIPTKYLFYPGETDAGDLQIRIVITIPLAALPKSEKIPDASLSQHDYLPGESEYTSKIP